MTGNFTLPTDVMNECTDTFIHCFAKWASDVTNGAFWVLALLSFITILYLATARFGGTRAFGFASFVGLLGGVWLAILQLIPWWLGSSFIIMGVIGIISMVLSEK